MTAEGGFALEKLASNFQLAVSVDVGGSTATDASTGCSCSVVLLTGTHCRDGTARLISGSAFCLTGRLKINWNPLKYDGIHPPPYQTLAMTDSPSGSLGPTAKHENSTGAKRNRFP